jgi:uncharacterized protein
MRTIRVGEFEWDASKAATNVKKHGISFEEAMTVFLDELSLPMHDLVHPDRLAIIGSRASERSFW